MFTSIVMRSAQYGRRALLFGTLAAVCLGSNVTAQDPKGGLAIAKVKGELQSIAGFQIKLATADKKEMMAVINPQKTNFSYVGKADPAFLMPGLMVRFTGAFDAAGRPNGTIKELEIFTPAQKRRMTAEYMQNQTAGVYPVDETAAAKGDDKSPKKPDNKNTKQPNTKQPNTKQPNTKQPNAKQPNAKDAKADVGGKRQLKETTTTPGGFENYRVVGKIAAIQGNMIRVAAGNLPITIQLEPDANITVSSGDTTFCMEGDQVEITGLRNSAQESVVQAETVLITGAKPLGSAEQQTQKKPGSRNRRDKGSGDAKSDEKLAPKAGVKSKPGDRAKANG